MIDGCNYEKIETQVTVTQYKTPDGQIFDKSSEAYDHNIWIERKEYLTEKFYEEIFEMNKVKEIFPYNFNKINNVEEIKNFIWVKLAKDEQKDSSMGYITDNGSTDGFENCLEFDEDMPFDYDSYQKLKHNMLIKYGYKLSTPYYYWGK